MLHLQVPLAALAVGHSAIIFKCPPIDIAVRATDAETQGIGKRFVEDSMMSVMLFIAEQWRPQSQSGLTAH